LNNIVVLLVYSLPSGYWFATKKLWSDRCSLGLLRCSILNYVDLFICYK
jgi:hypothetical protein